MELKLDPLPYVTLQIFPLKTSRLFLIFCLCLSTRSRAHVFYMFVLYVYICVGIIMDRFDKSNATSFNG